MHAPLYSVHCTLTCVWRQWLPLFLCVFFSLIVSTFVLPNAHPQQHGIIYLFAFGGTNREHSYAKIARDWLHPSPVMICRYTWQHTCLICYAYNIYSTSIIRMSICLCADRVSAHLLSPHHLPSLHRTVDLHFFISLTGIYMTQNYIDATTKINIKLLCAPMFFMPFQIHMYTLVPQIVNNK